MFVSILGLLAGSGFALCLFALSAPLFKDDLTNEPDKPKKLAFFTAVEPNQGKSIVRGGRFIRFLINKPGYGPSNTIGIDHPEEHYEIGVSSGSSKTNGVPFGMTPWSWWKWYIYRITGLHVTGFPPFQGVDTYPLPRFKEEVGQNGPELVFGKQDERSDHVRLKPFTWFFVIEGVEIETVPFKISGSLQLEVKNPYLALYNVNSWNVIVNQAVRAVGRSLFLGKFRLSDVIGGVEKDIWATAPEVRKETLDELGHQFLEKLENYKFKLKGDTVAEQDLRKMAGVDVLSIDITDIKPELDPEQLKKLQAALFARELAKARQIEGTGEAAFQQKILEIAEKYGDLGKRMMETEAFVRAAKEGTLDALATGFLAKLTKSA